MTTRKATTAKTNDMLERFEAELVDQLCRRHLSASRHYLLAGELNEESLQDDVEDRDEEEVEHGGEHHAADDGSAHRVAAVSSRACGEEERADTEDEGDGGHQDGTEAEFSGFDGGLSDGAALLQELLGELDD